MHSGQANNSLFYIKLTITACLFLFITLAFSCNDQAGPEASVNFRLPEQGQTFAQGEQVKVQLDVPKGENIVSATYLLDGKEVSAKSNAEPVSLTTEGLNLGYKLITAIVDNGSKKDTLTINIVLKSPVKPKEYTYKVVKEFVHDTSAYTQGLEYHNGRFLESTGQRGNSTLRWVDAPTGKVLQKIDLDKKYFGEGSTLVGDKVVMLTWEENIGFVFDAKSFKELATFPYQSSRQGWGLCFDGSRLIKSDGTNRIWFLNKDTYKEESFIDVFDDKGAVESINELEFIDGKIYANVYLTDNIIIIDPATGIVEGRIDLTKILSKSYFKTPDELNNDVLNGIAYDKQNKRLFVTGKKWPKLFEIALVPKK